jgi:hypothetical protein
VQKEGRHGAEFLLESNKFFLEPSSEFLLLLCPPGGGLMLRALPETARGISFQIAGILCAACVCVCVCVCVCDFVHVLVMGLSFSWKFNH